MNRKAWQVLLWANAGLIIWFWQSTSGQLLTLGAASVVLALGRLAGLFAAYLILLQFFFMGRTPYLERVYGLDRLARIHHTTGKYGLLLLLIHPILLTFGYARLAGISLIDQFLSFLNDYPYVFWALVGLFLFILVVTTSIYISRSKLKYELWYSVHVLAYLAVFASFFHQINVGTDLIANKIFYWYFLILYIFVFSHQILFRFLRPIYNADKYKFVVSRVERENYNTISIYITGKNISDFKIKPGQFMILRFLQKAFWTQAHPFSLSFVPKNNELRITPKAVGDYTARMDKILPGTQVVIDGPYGVFTDSPSAKKILFIAGGVGITPIRALLEETLKKGKDIVLLYANHTEKDIVFRDEIYNLTLNTSIKVVHILSRQPDYTGEQGRIDEEKFKRLVPDLNQREIYLCGPVHMMKAVRHILKHLKVSENQIHFEEFSLN